MALAVGADVAVAVTVSVGNSVVAVAPPVGALADGSVVAVGAGVGAVQPARIRLTATTKSNTRLLFTISVLSRNVPCRGKVTAVVQTLKNAPYAATGR